MSKSIETFMRKFKYPDERITHLLEQYDDLVYQIRDYDHNFELDSKAAERHILNSYQNIAFGILLSLFQMGHLTSLDFFMRMYALNTVFFQRVKY